MEAVIAENWIPGAKEFLNLVHNRSLKLFVISGTPETELKYILQRRGIADYFHECLGSPVKKPSHIRTLLEKYQLDPSQCLFIGDAYTDHDAALETGLHFIGIQGEVTFPVGTKVLKDCTELQGAIGEIFPDNKIF
jgi:HAD superfamily hydrolase (TIGR01549 family)